MVRYPLCVFVTALSLSPAAAQTLLGAADVLDALPPTVLKGARAVALVPRGASVNPQGVLLVRGEAGWGGTEFVTLREAPGTRETPDYVIVFRTRRSVDRILNGDGRLDHEVQAYAGRGGSFAPVSLDGAALRKGGLFAGTPDRKLSAEMSTKLTERTAPQPAPPVAIDWPRVLEHREVFMGGFAALGAGLAMLKRRRR